MALQKGVFHGRPSQVIDVTSRQPYRHSIPPELLNRFADQAFILNPDAPHDLPNPERLTPADFIRAGLAGAVRTPGTSAHLAEVNRPGQFPMLIARPANRTNQHYMTIPTNERPFKKQR